LTGIVSSGCFAGPVPAVATLPESDGRGDEPPWVEARSEREQASKALASEVVTGRPTSDDLLISDTRISPTSNGFAGTRIWLSGPALIGEAPESPATISPTVMAAKATQVVSATKFA